MGVGVFFFFVASAGDVSCDFAFGSAFEPGGLFAALGQLALGHFGVFGHGGRRCALCLELCVCLCICSDYL